jgi:predicted ATP-dependent endonuclease of OLD family
MIWPNGSGKSNLLDIIHAVRKYGITINYELTNENNISRIILANNTSHSLKKHRWQEEKKSHIYMSLLLSQDDYNNLFFLFKNREIINTLILEYSQEFLQFWTITKEELLEYSKIPLYLSLDENNSLILEENTNPVINFIYNYFQNFELIQLCIDIYNNHGWNRYPLRNTFALITSENNYADSNIPKSIHLFCKKFNSLTQESNNNISLLKDFFIETTNNILKKYTWLQLSLQHNLSESSFLLKNNQWYTLWYEELSSGEQSFLSLILLIYSHDLHNGFLIIDEPELHLHPQSQKNFLALVEEMQNKQHMQCIIATHSPTMVNEHNINHVFRCSKIHWETIISSTSSRFWENESNLLQMLKFDHIAKIFFVDTIILVEWETDMYFFSHYIEYLKTLPERSDRINNYEIITISGKWWVRRRKQFLKKFNNRVYYIWDRDNTIEYNLLSHQELSSLPHHRLNTNKWSKYAAIIQHIQKNKSDLYTRIVQWIQKLYSNNIFLLTQWDLEAYIWIQSKWLDYTIHFCVHDFSHRIQDPMFLWYVIIYFHHKNIRKFFTKKIIICK